MMILPLATLLSLLTAVVIPGVSSLLSRAHWPSDVRAVLTVVLSLASGFLSELAIHPNDYRTTSALLTALVAYVIAAASRSQLWRKSGLDAALLNVGSKA